MFGEILYVKLNQAKIFHKKSVALFISFQVCSKLPLALDYVNKCLFIRNLSKNMIPNQSREIVNKGFIHRPSNKMPNFVAQHDKCFLVNVGVCGRGPKHKMCRFSKSFTFLIRNRDNETMEIGSPINASKFRNGLFKFQQLRDV